MHFCMTSGAASLTGFDYVIIVLKKTSQFKTVCKDDSGYIGQLKQQNQKGDIT